MQPNPSDSAELLRARHYRRMGYFACRRAVETLRRFKALVAYDYHLDSIDQIEPLETLLPGAPADPHRRGQMLSREIQRMVPLVSDLLHIACINTGMVMDRIETDPLTDQNPRRVNVEYDLLEHYGDAHHDKNLVDFNYLQATLERGIGVYDHKRRFEFRRLFNPLVWLGRLVGLPVRVLEEAGLGTDSASSRGMQIWAWAMRIAVLVIFVLLATKLGVSVPWERLLQFLPK